MVGAVRGEYDCLEWRGVFCYTKTLIAKVYSRSASHILPHGTDGRCLGRAGAFRF